MADRSGPGSPHDDELTRLIEHGRDREAAELAARQPTTSQGAPMDPRQQLDAVLPLLEGLVAELDDAQLDLPTRSTSFTVGQVVEHLVGGATLFGAAFRGEEPEVLDPSTDPRIAFPKAVAALRDGAHAAGALERTIAAPFGEVPGDVFARFVVMDGMVHGWDIASATGQAYDPPADVVAEVDAFTRQAITDGMRDGETFAAAVTAPAGASPLESLVAFTGRRL